MRIDASGNPLDPAPLVVTQEAAPQSNPQVVWNGTNWLVLFESVDINGTGFYYAPSLEAVRLSPTGVVLDPKPIKIRDVAPVGSSWTAASDGTDWVVAFQESDMSSALSLLRITAAGGVLQPPKVVVPSTYYLRFNLKLAYTNGVFLFTWGDFYDTSGSSFDSSLTVLDPARHARYWPFSYDLTSSEHPVLRRLGSASGVCRSDRWIAYFDCGRGAGRWRKRRRDLE